MDWYKISQSEIHDEYLDAIKNGDKITIERMIASVAASKGYKYFLYHGTNNTKFIKDKSVSGDQNAKEALKSIHDSLVKDGTFNEPLKDLSDLAVILERMKHPQASEARRLYELSRTRVKQKSYEIPGFNTFIPGEFGVHFGNEGAASMFGTVFPFYVMITKLFRTEDLGTWDYQNVLRSARKSGISISEKEYDDVFNSQDEQLAARKLLLGKGYDGIVYQNEVEGRGDSYIIFSSNQAKLANVTMDDSGKIIPLQKRFNSKSQDIRY